MAAAEGKSSTSDKVSTSSDVDEGSADPRSRRWTWREAWWPLAVAVAWVLLRSQQVVEQLLNRHSRKPITFRFVDIYAADLKVGGQHTTPKFENSNAAFDELRHPLETGEIEIVGTPFVRVGDLEGSSRLEMGDQQTISSSEMSSLVHYDDYGELCLIPRDWRKAHGSTRTNLRGYRNVLVRSAQLAGRFPPIDPTAPGAFVLTVPAPDAFVLTVPAPDATLFGDGAPVEERTQPVPSDAVVREKMGTEPTKPVEPKMVPPKWLALAREQNPRNPDEGAGEHIRRLHGLMQMADNVTEVWTFGNFRRRYYE